MAFVLVVNDDVDDALDVAVQMGLEQPNTTKRLFAVRCSVFAVKAATNAWPWWIGNG